MADPPATLDEIEHDGATFYLDEIVKVKQYAQVDTTTSPVAVETSIDVTSKVKTSADVVSRSEPRDYAVAHPLG